MGPEALQGYGTDSTETHRKPCRVPQKIPGARMVQPAGAGRGVDAPGADSSWIRPVFGRPDRVRTRSVGKAMGHPAGRARPGRAACAQDH